MYIEAEVLLKRTPTRLKKHYKSLGHEEQKLVVLLKDRFVGLKIRGMGAMACFEFAIEIALLYSNIKIKHLLETVPLSHRAEAIQYVKDGAK